jgi:ribosomal protein L11 methyltransferase
LQSILIQSEINNREALITELWERGTKGVIESADSVQAFFEDELPVEQIVRHLNYPILEVSNETPLASAFDSSPDRDPIYVGRQFFIVSSGMDQPAPPGRKRLVIDANDSFGSGSHESTRLVVQALEEYLPVNATVLDVGCGSGILSAIAQELGAAQVFACDTHIGALLCTQIHSPASHFFVGSIDALAPSFVDVAIVNISANTIDRLTDELYRVVRPTGLLILAGFTVDHTPARVRPEKVFQLNDWLCWLCHPQNLKLAQTKEALQPFPVQWW